METTNEKISPLIADEMSKEEFDTMMAKGLEQAKTARI